MADSEDTFPPSDDESDTRKTAFGPNDYFIAVMGMVGVGKSAFIKHLSGEPVKIGHSRQACTQKVEFYPVECKRDVTVWLLDTPGFGDSHRPDSEVLKEIAAHLADPKVLYENRKSKLDGIIYLHRITDARMGGSARTNLSTLQKLCGQKALANMILATTMWEHVFEQVGIAQEEELKRTEHFWGGMIAHGSTVLRHMNTPESALSIIQHFIKNGRPQERPKMVLALQEELVDQELTLDQTGAGQEVYNCLTKKLSSYQVDVNYLQEDLVQARELSDVHVAKILVEERARLEVQMTRVLEQRKILNVTFEELYKERLKHRSFRTDGDKVWFAKNFGSQWSSSRRQVEKPPPPEAAGPELLLARFRRRMKLWKKEGRADVNSIRKGNRVAKFAAKIDNEAPRQLVRQSSDSIREGENADGPAARIDKKEPGSPKSVQTDASPEYGQEHRFTLDIIFSKLDYIVNRILFAAPLGIHVIRYLRPKLPAGFKRIEWQSPCGVLLHDDYRVTTPASARALDSLKRKLQATTLSSSNDSSYASPSTSMRGEGRSQSSSSQMTMSSVDLADQRQSMTRPPDRSSLMRKKQRSWDVNLQIFLELCVNTEPHRIVLEEIRVKTGGGNFHIDNDLALFQTIRNIYYAERHKTKYRWLRIPIDVHFVKFAGSMAEPQAFYVDIYEEPKALPPQKIIDENQYQMDDLSDLEQPIGKNAFLYLLRSNPISIDSNHCIWLPRFPKKCGESIIPPSGNRLIKIEPAWGIRVIEGPNSELFLLATVVLAVLCVVLGLVIASALGDTYRGVAVAVGGFGIGSYLLKETKEWIKDSTGPSKEKKS